MSATSLRDRIPPHHPVRGQALVLGLFFAFAIAGVMYFMFNSGRAVDEKLRITNAADAIAYSVALMEGRALNYDAYVNRAIVANQVAIAQAVSLVSWLHYYEGGVENADRLASVAATWLFDPAAYPRLAQLLGVLGGTAYVDHWSGGSLREIVSAMDISLGAIVSAHDSASQALSASQAILHAGVATGSAQQALASELARRIDPAMSAELVGASHGFGTFTRAYARSGGDGEGDGDERGRLADVVMRSADRFTRERAWSLHGPDVPFIQRNAELKRRGGTELIDYDEWRAMDTLEHEGQRLRKGRWRWTRTSLAWGAASARGEDAGGGRGDHGGSYRDNSQTSTLYAEPAMTDLASVGSRFSGLPTSRELADLGRDARYTTGVTVRLSKPRHAMRLSGGNSNVEPRGRLRQFDSTPPGDEMAALARAEVFFDRSTPRGDGKREYPSLYSPYWQVRLTNPTASDRAWAAARQGGVALP